MPSMTCSALIPPRVWRNLLFHHFSTITFADRSTFFNVTNTEGSAFPPPFDIWGTPPSCRHTSDMCHGRRGRSCSSGGPYTLDS